MKLNYFVTAFAVSIVILGCQKEDTSVPEDQSILRRELIEKSEQTSQEVGKGVAAAQDLAGQAKQEFVAAASQTLKEMDAAMNDLRQKTSTLTADAKSGAEAALAKLKEQHQAAADQLANAKNASAEAWQDTIRPGLESALDGLKAAYEDVKSSFPEN